MPYYTFTYIGDQWSAEGAPTQAVLETMTHVVSEELAHTADRMTPGYVAQVADLFLAAFDLGEGHEAPKLMAEPFQRLIGTSELFAGLMAALFGGLDESETCERALRLAALDTAAAMTPEEAQRLYRFAKLIVKLQSM